MEARNRVAADVVRLRRDERRGDEGFHAVGAV
jgi:hypothetical protein